MADCYAALQYYVDVAYCYRWSNVACQSICLSVTITSPAKTSETIAIPFGMWTRVGPRKHVLDGGLH